MKAEISEFEKQTSYCPLYLAWRILPSSPRLRRGRRLHRRARDYFRTPIPEAFADKLARRAEAVFAHHPFWARKASPRAGQRQFQSQRQREYILMSMRHWLAGELARERPALFRALPESFKVGHPLPLKQGGAAAPPYHKTVGLTCRSAQISKRRRARLVSPKSDEGGSDAPYLRFVHGCELLAI